MQSPCLSNRSCVKKTIRDRKDLVQDVEYQLPFKPVEFHSAVAGRSKMSQKIRCQYYLVFVIDLKNTNLVEDVEILVPVKFH